MASRLTPTSVRFADEIATFHGTSGPKRHQLRSEIIQSIWLAMPVNRDPWPRADSTIWAGGSAAGLTPQPQSVQGKHREGTGDKEAGRDVGRDVPPPWVKYERLAE